jgi:hypothetical protein
VGRPYLIPPTTSDFKISIGNTRQRKQKYGTLIAEENAANTILCWLAEMWNLQERLNIAKEPKKEYFLSIRVFSDI